MVDIVPRGRRAIGVDQQPGGSFYPLLTPVAGFDNLLADLYLQYPDRLATLPTPFRILWLYGFGEGDPTSYTGIRYHPAAGDPVASNGEASYADAEVLDEVPIVPLHAYDMAIVDDDGNPVFSTLDATDYRETVWDDRLKILEWSVGEYVLRATTHIAWGPTDVPHDYPIYAAFDPAMPLDDRTLGRLSNRLESLILGLDTLTGKPITLKAGYNCQLALTTAEAVDGQAIGNSVTINLTAGNGLGRFPPDCSDLLLVRTINRTAGTESGGFTLNGDDWGCMRVVPKVQSLLSEASELAPKTVAIQANALQLVDDCKVCVKCEDFIAVYEALRRLSLRTADLFARATAVRDSYALLRETFIQQKNCREQQTLRIVIDPFCPCTASFAVGFCNQTNECLTGVTIPISFVYDGEGVTAASNPVDVAILPNTTYRGGFVDLDQRKAISRESYRLLGSWPHYRAYFPKVNPRQKPYVTWYMKFQGCSSSDLIELVADAYVTEADDGIIPGYTPGSGPDEEALENRLTTGPAKAAVSLLPSCDE
jgi:hypothetical protein